MERIYNDSLALNSIGKAEAQKQNKRTLFTKKMNWQGKAIWLGFVFILLSGYVLGQPAVGDYRSAGTGNWTTLASWERLNALPDSWDLPTTAQGYPGQYTGTGNVLIYSEKKITLDISPNNAIGSLTITQPGNTGNTSLSIGSNNLNISGGISINSGGKTDRPAILTISTGTVTCGGSILFNANTAGGCQLTFTGAGTLNLGGSFGTGGTFTAGTSTVNYNGTAAQSIGAYSYYNLTCSNTGTKTTTAATSVSNKLLIENGSTLVSTFPITITSGKTFQIDNGGTYIHNNTGTGTNPSSTIFQGIEIFGASSNVRIDNWHVPTPTTIPPITTNVSLPFGNLEINWTVNTGAWQQGWTTSSFNLCAGDFKITSTGTGRIRLTESGAPTITIGGDYIQTGGYVECASSSSGAATINVAGDFNFTGGTITESGTNSNFVFNGTTPQVYASGGNLANQINFTVNSGSVLDMGSSVMSNTTGSGTFTLNPGAGIMTANINGLSLTGNTGSVQLATRTYNTGANYTYNGTTAQVTGNGLTGANILTINNSAGVSLSASAPVTTLALQLGALSIGDKTLTLNGTFTGSGTLTGEANSVLEIGGTSGGNLGTINFTGGSGTLKTFNVNRTGAVSIGSNLTIKENMSITSGILTLLGDKWLTVEGELTNGSAENLVIESGSSLIQGSSAVEATVKRYIDAATWTQWNDGWHFLSSPVQSQKISSSGGFTTAGPPSDDFDFYAWSEPYNIWVNIDNSTVTPTWNSVNNNSDIFQVGKGYLVAYQQSSTKVFSGTLNNSDVTVTGLTNNTISTNHSWNLLGNPYPAALIWDGSSDWALSNVGGVCQIWSNALHDYTSFSSGTIPALNGFMVEVTTEPAQITIPATKQTHAVNTWYKSTASEGQLKLTVMAQDNSSGKEAFIQVNPESTELFDLEYDGHYLRGYGPVFYSVAGSDTLSVNTLPLLNESLVIPLNFQKNESTDFVITASGVANFETPVYLTDKKTGIIQNLGYNPVYSFSSAENDNINRFTLSFKSPTSISEEIDENFIVNVTDGIITINQSESLTGKVKVSDMLGRTVAMENLVADTPLKINLNSVPGVYVVTVYTKSKTYSQKVVIR